MSKTPGKSVPLSICLLLAAEAGDANGEFYLAHALRRKILSASIIGTAMALLNRAAEKGHPDAIYELWRAYGTGDGIEKDAEKAVDLLLKAAGAGSGHAFLDMADLSFKNFDNPANRRNAYVYYRLAHLL